MAAWFSPVGECALHHQRPPRSVGAFWSLFGPFPRLDGSTRGGGGVGFGKASSRLRPLPMIPRSSHWVHELVHQPLGHHGLPDDSLLVVLADGAAQLVVVHGRPVLPQAPEAGHVRRILDLKDSCGGGAGDWGLLLARY